MQGPLEHPPVAEAASAPPPTAIAGASRIGGSRAA